MGRKRPPDTRKAVNRKIEIGGHEMFMHIGFYPDNHQPSELFVEIAKEGSTLSGLLDTIATLTSYCLQYGVPWDFLLDKFRDTNYLPRDDEYSSIPDAIFREGHDLILENGGDPILNCHGETDDHKTGIRNTGTARSESIH